MKGNETRSNIRISAVAYLNPTVIRRIAAGDALSESGSSSMICRSKVASGVGIKSLNPLDPSRSLLHNQINTDKLIWDCCRDYAGEYI